MNLKWGILGAGNIAHDFCDDFVVAGEGQLIAAYARKKEKVTLFCKRYDIPHAYDQLEDFLENKEIDVVYIALPHALHYEATLKALEAGKHVICEKPLAMNAKQVKVMQKRAKEKGLFLMEALWTKFLPAVRQAVKWVHEGAIGDLKLIEANFGFLTDEETPDRVRNPQMGGGALLDVGIYPLLIANWIAGNKPSQIHAMAHMTETGIDGTVMMQCYYESGIYADLKASIDIDFSNTCRIYGSKGYIELPSFWMADEAFLVKDGKRQAFSEKIGMMKGYQYEIIAAENAIKKGWQQHPEATHDFSLELMATMDDIRQRIGLVYESDRQ